MDRDHSLPGGIIVRKNFICYDHSRSEVQRSRSQDHIFINNFFLRKINGRTCVQCVRLGAPMPETNARQLDGRPQIMSVLGADIFSCFHTV